MARAPVDDKITTRWPAKAIHHWTLAILHAPQGLIGAVLAGCDVLAASWR
jgi:hypothetical protein